MTSGRGVMAKKMGPGALSQQLFDEATGTSLAPGTLNIRLARPTPFPPRCTRIARRSGRAPGSDIVNLTPARINDIRAWAIRHATVEARGDTSLVELVAEANLRQLLGLCDGDRVSIEF